MADDEEIPSYLQPYVGQSPRALAREDSDHPFGGSDNLRDDEDEGADGEDEADEVVEPLPAKIRYVAFSGGGGKGFAFLGALAALGEFGLLTNPALEAEKAGEKSGSEPDDFFLDDDRLAGVAGTSAGAITAALLAGKVGLGEAYDLLMDEDDTTRFFDEAVLSRYEVPRLDGVETVMRPAAEQALLMPIMGGFDAAKSEVDAVLTATRDFLTGASGGDETVEDVLSSGGEVVEYGDAQVPKDGVVREPFWVVGKALQHWNDRSDLGLPERAIRQVFQTGQFPLYAAGLLGHEGVFAGSYVPEYVEDGIRAGLRTAGATDPGRDLTFAELRAASGLDLVVVGADLEAGEARGFGTQSTPGLPVTDAVRLSMALPFVYRPTRVEAGPHRGSWVDGGLLNNFPLHAFEPEGLAASPTVLGLRLDPPSGEIDGVWDLVGSVTGTLLDRSSRNQVYTPVEAEQVVDVPTGDLTTMGFAPDPDVVERAMVDAATSVFEHYGARPPYAEYKAEKVVDERVYGNRPEAVARSAPDVEDVPKAIEEQERYETRGYVEGIFRSEMLATIKAGARSDTADGSTGWEPHPLAFLLDPLVRRGDAAVPVDHPDQLVDPKREREAYRQGVDYWSPGFSPRKFDDWQYFDRGRRPMVDAGHMTSKRYLQDRPHEFERFALEDRYLNQRRRADLIESKGGVVEDPWAVDIAGVPVERETARRLELDVDPAAEGYFEMSDEARARFRRRHFPIDLEFPEWKPFGGVLGGLPKGTVDRKLDAGETTRGWIYFGPYTDRRRIEAGSQ